MYKKEDLVEYYREKVILKAVGVLEENIFDLPRTTPNNTQPADLTEMVAQLIRYISGRNHTS